MSHKSKSHLQTPTKAQKNFETASVYTASQAGSQTGPYWQIKKKITTLKSTLQELDQGIFIFIEI